MARPFRQHIPFEKEFTFTLRNLLFWEAAPVVYRSQALDLHSLTHVEVYATIDVLTDTAPNNAIGFIGSLGQRLSSEGVPGPLSSIGFGIPGLPNAKGYFGVGEYSLFLTTGGTSTGADGLGLNANFVLNALGTSHDRRLTVRVDGAIVAGKTKITKRRRL